MTTDTGVRDTVDSRLSVVISNFNGAGVLPATLAALEQIRGLDLEVIIVDDGSTDGSREWAAATHSSYRVIALERNSGRLNLVRNRGLRACTRRFVFLMDNDIVVTEACLRELLRVLRAHDDVVCCTPRLLYSDDPSRIYSDGGGLHFLCISSKSVRGEPVAQHPAMAPRASLGTGIMLLDAVRARELEFFDETFPAGWGDDGEFHMRAWLRGLRCLHVPAATCLHVERPHGRARIFAQLANRQRLLVTMYARRSLLLLAPPLLVFEFAVFAAALLNGFADQYIAAWRATFRDRAALRARRALLQRTRVRPDSVYLSGGSIVPGGALRRSRAVRAATAILSAPLSLYWYVVRRFL